MGVIRNVSGGIAHSMEHIVRFGLIAWVHPVLPFTVVFSPPNTVISEHWPELPQLGRRSVDHCDVFPVALGVEAIYLNRLRCMKLMVRAAIGTAHWIKCPILSTRSIEAATLLRTDNSPLSALQLASGTIRAQSPKGR